MSSFSVHTCQQSRDLDQLVIEEFGIPGFELMSRAGLGAFSVLQKHWPECRQIAVFCGVGNNGGDGYILARAALEAGIHTQVFRLGQSATLDAKKACHAYTQIGGTIDEIDGNIDFQACDVVVDALFGSGLGRDIKDLLQRVMQRINSSGKPVLALDIPSGIDGDTGQVRGIALQADVTVTFISTKLGLVSGEAKDYRGILELDTLGVPQTAYQKVQQAATLIDAATVAAWKLIRKASAHKGDAGRVLIVGGNHTMYGAALMAGQAAFRAGAGLVSVASVAGFAEKIAMHTPEIRGFAVDSDADLEPLIDSCDVAGVGPGLGQDAWAAMVWETLWYCAVRKVVDADALNLLASAPQHCADWILTPHPGEAARLLECSTRAVQNDRIAAAHAISERYGGICVLKGSSTVVAGGEQTWICDRGNPGMATGGMGDILTGLISALWAQRLSAEEAACLGVWLHACAGDDSAKAAGTIGMMATDLLPGIRSNLAQSIDNAASVGS